MLVQTLNPQWAQKDRWRFAVAEFLEFSGQEVQLKHVGPESLALTTGNPEWPVRVIPRSWIVKIDGAAYSHTSSQTLTKTVKGSKGELYVVTLGEKPSCTCSGFTFRKTCKHIQ